MLDFSWLFMFVCGCSFTHLIDRVIFIGGFSKSRGGFGCPTAQGLLGQRDRWIGLKRLGLQLSKATNEIKVP